MQCSLMFTGKMQGQVQLRFESVRNSGALWKRKNMVWYIVPSPPTALVTKSKVTHFRKFRTGKPWVKTYS